jgi:hypothetical protein
METDMAADVTEESHRVREDNHDDASPLNQGHAHVIDLATVPPMASCRTRSVQ